jgi:DNA-binding beta-propeller fold protein YncE
VYDKGEVVEIDPATARIVRTVDVGIQPRDLAFANGSVWVVNELSDTVSRFAPRARRKAAR